MPSNNPHTCAVICVCLCILAQLHRTTCAENGTSKDEGAIECPCLSEVPPAVRTTLSSLGYPAGYGEKECKAHDESLALSGCKEGQATALCKQRWCFIDAPSCRVDKRKCEAAGFRVGSFGSPFCRSRSMHSADFFCWGKNKEENGTSSCDLTNVYYSYTTCGSVATSTQKNSEVWGNEIVVALAESRPWTIKGKEVDPKRPQWKGWSGVLVDLIDGIASEEKANLKITIRDEFASADSMAVFPGSSYTACVLDVRIGKVDICLADFWITPERISLAPFLTPVSQDQFYLLVPDDPAEETIWEMFEKPFRPFSWDLWALILGFLVFCGIINAVCDYANSEEFINSHAGARVFKGTYMAIMGLFCGGPMNSPVAAPARIAQMGYGFFILVILSSYTANLAAILVAKSDKQGINTIEDAIAQHVTICVLQAIKSQATAQSWNSPMPAAFYESTSSLNQIRDLNLGKCGAALIHEQNIMRAFSGDHVVKDCADKKLSAENYTVLCELTETGLPDKTRDCKRYKKVGNLLFTTPISMPVRSPYDHVFNYYLRESQESGAYNHVLKTYEQETPQSACPVSEDASGDDMSLPSSRMYGTVMISVFCQVVALLLFAVEICKKRSLAEIFACSDESKADTNDAHEMMEGEESSKQDATVDFSKRKENWDLHPRENGPSDPEAPVATAGVDIDSTICILRAIQALETSMNHQLGENGLSENSKAPVATAGVEIDSILRAIQALDTRMDSIVSKISSTTSKDDVERIVDTRMARAAVQVRNNDACCAEPLSLPASCSNEQKWILAKEKDRPMSEQSHQLHWMLEREREREREKEQLKASFQSRVSRGQATRPSSKELHQKPAEGDKASSWQQGHAPSFKKLAHEFGKTRSDSLQSPRGLGSPRSFFSKSRASTGQQLPAYILKRDEPPNGASCYTIDTPRTVVT